MREAVKKAIENNDLVIVAGDSSNDWPMLHPLSYINLPPDCSSIYELDLIKHSEFIKKYNEMPFIGIIIDRESQRKDKGFLLDDYGRIGRTSKSLNPYLNPKIIKVKKGHLDDGIREAIKLYSQQNPKYRAQLKESLEREIS